MESISGVKILRQDLKEEDGKFVYFKALEDIRLKTGVSPKILLNDQLFEKYDSLMVTTTDELMGEKDEKLEFLEKIKGAYALSQQMFVSG